MSEVGNRIRSYPPRMKRIVLVAVAVALTAGCSSGPAAPDPGTGSEVCADSFCVTVPDGWDIEVGDTYVSAHHELAPDTTFLTAGEINQRALVENAGGQWPMTTPEVARAFWTLLERADVGSFSRSARMLGGAERSWGQHESGTMWHLLYPLEGEDAIGVELRAPNDSWEQHADVVFESVRSL